MIRDQAEVVEVNKYPNVWKGKKCDGVYTRSFQSLYYHRERLFGFHSPFHLPFAEFLAILGVNCFIKVLPYLHFYYLLVKMIMPETSGPNVTDQKSSKLWKTKLNNIVLGGGPENSLQVLYYW